MLKLDYSDEVKDSCYAFLIIKQQQTIFVLRLHYDKCLFFEFKFLPIWDALYIAALLRKTIFTQCIYYVYIL